MYPEDITSYLEHNIPQTNIQRSEDSKKVHAYTHNFEEPPLVSNVLETVKHLPLTHIYLTGFRVSGEDATKIAALFPNITHLELGRQIQDPITVSLPNLTHLTVSSATDSEICLLFPDLPNLTHLKLKSLVTAHTDLYRIASTYPKLSHLDLSKVVDHSNIPQALATLPHLPNLTRIHINSQKFPFKAIYKIYHDFEETNPQITLDPL